MTTSISVLLRCTFVLDYREHHPFVTVYLTKDVAASRNHYALVKSSDSTSRIDGATILVKARAGALDRVEPDAALCIQGYCHLENGNGEPCVHRTGHSNVLLSALKKSAETGTPVSLPLNNRTHESTGRGTVTVSVVDASTVAALKRAVFAPETELTLFDKNANRYISVFSQYRDRTDAIVEMVPPVRDDIPLSRLPFYAFNTFAAPPIAFALFDVPRNPEEYYLNALRITLRRRHRDSSGVSDRRLMDVFMDDSQTTWAERGAVLCSVVAVFVNACPYITDYGLWTDARTREMKLRSVEEFTRTVRLTLSGDCEDFTCEMIMELADILTNTWLSPQMRLLQRVRQQYVAGLPLKMVTRPAAYSEKHEKIGNGKGAAPKPVKRFAAHNNVDLIPVELYVEMQERLAADTVPEELRPSAAAVRSNKLLLQERRPDLVRDNRDLGILIIEGTGMYRPDGAVDVARSERKQLVKSNPQAFAMAKHQIREKAGNLSRFYLATVSAIVWDTFALYSTEAPTTAQTFYTTSTPEGLKYAARHPEYIRADSTVGIYAPPPITPAEMEMMRHMQRYDHPIPVITPVDNEDARRIELALLHGIPAVGVEQTWGLARLAREIGRLGVPEHEDDVHVDYHFPADTMNSARVMDIWIAVQRSGIVNGLTYYVEPVARGLALVLLRFRCNRHFTLQ